MGYGSWIIGPAQQSGCLCGVGLEKMVSLSKVEIIGAGPAGLYTSILLRRLLPQVEVRVSEQNPWGATYGFGVVFSEQALEFLKADDPETLNLILPQMSRWENIRLNLPDDSIVIDGIGFTSIGRLNLIETLFRRAKSLGVVVDFDRKVESLDELDAELIVGADGLNSIVRRSLESEFKPAIQHFSNYFAWFGAERAFETLTQTFVRTGKGALNAHHYRYCSDRSTFLVECNDAVFRSYGFDNMVESESAAVCEVIFRDVLEGAHLIANNSAWRQFPKLWCEKWTSGRCALIGDAVHTIHYSIGSGTRFAMEDAIALTQALATHDELETAFAAYQSKRAPIARKLFDAAAASAQWYEAYAEHMSLRPLEFAYQYINRSGRLDNARLRNVAPNFMRLYEGQ